MSTEAASRKKKTPSDSTPAPDGDHRKRRRNRTTQSCLNCHTSKRMCDRKRPACARCTQLGLTGLCVYEVDDPSQRVDTQDESSRLLKRVAELEGVIRELKNKPHPRWVQSNTPGEEFEKWHTRPQGGGDEPCASDAPSPPISSSSSDKGDSCSTRSSSLHPNVFNSSLAPSIHLQVTPDTRRMRSPFSPSSPLSGSSPGLMTPTDEYTFSPVGVAGQGSLQDYDLTSMFMNYPGTMGVGDNSALPLPDPRYNKQSGHCGCVNDTTNYNNMLELSVRLRKASDVLNRSPAHQLGGYCQLHQRVSELDSFATNVLSDISSSPSERAQQTYPSQIFHQRIPQPRGSMPSGSSWDIMPINSNSPPSFDDSFMTWEPPRRT